MQRSAVNVAGAQRAPGRGPLHQQTVVRPTQQLVVPQGELVPGQKVSAAHRAAETLHVIDVVPSPHHQVAAAEAHVTLCTLDAKQPESGDAETHGVTLQHWRLSMYSKRTVVISSSLAKIYIHIY